MQVLKPSFVPVGLNECTEDFYTDIEPGLHKTVSIHLPGDRSQLAS